MKKIFIGCIVGLISLLFLLLLFVSCITDPKKDPNFSLEALSETSSSATLNSGVGLQLRLTNKDDQSHTFSVKVSSSLGLNAKSNLKETFTLKKKTYADFWVNFDIPNNASLLNKTEETRVWAEHSDGKKSDVITFYTQIKSEGSSIKFVQNTVCVAKDQQFATDGWRPGKWDGNTFSGSWDMQQFGSHYKGNMLAEYDATTNMMTKFVWNETKQGIYSLSYELKNMAFDHYYDYGTYNLTFKESGKQCANHVVYYQRISYHNDGTTYTDNSAEFYDSSEIVLWFSTE